MSTFGLVELGISKEPNLCVGIVKPDGVAFIKVCCENSILVEKWSSPKIVNVCDKLGMTFCGNEADFRALTGYAKKQSSRYQKIYEAPISIKMVAKEVSALLNQYTRDNNLRPFAVSILLGAGGVMYKINAGGEVFRYEDDIQVLGDKSEQITAVLTRDNVKSLPFDQAVDKCVAVLRQVANLQPGDIRVSRCNATSNEAGSGFTTAVI